MADGLVPVVVSPVPFSRQIHDLTVREGATVLAMLVEAVRSGKLAAADLSRTTIYVDGERLQREEALETVLSAGQIINVVVEPLGGGGGGGKDIGQIVLTIAVIVASAWVGGPTGPLAAMSALVRTVASAAVMAVGQAAIGALFAPDRDAQAKANDRYALQSASNQYRPWSPFPMALGEVIVAPDLAVKTFTQSRGDDVWIYGILGLHYGACEVSEEKIGDTLASTMGAGDVQFVRHLTPGPRTFQLYPNDVDQLDLTEELEATTGSATPVLRAGSAEGEKFEFDFFLPQGLHFQKDDGRVLTASVTMTVRYRAVDEDGQPIGGGGWSNGLTIPLSSTTKEPWRVTRALTLPLGRYEFEIKRSTKPDSNEKRRDQVALTAIRSIAFRKPITDETLSIIEFAVRATALNQGTLAPITCRIKPVCQTWNAAAGAWSGPQATSNPAALTRWLLSGPAPVRPEAPERVDVGLRAWSELCETYDWTTNVYLTELKTQAEAMALLEQAGRASLFWDGTQIVASPWVEKPSPVQMFAGDNLRDHKWTMAYVEPVHALRVEFQNLDQGGEPDELYVYADGYAETAGGGKEAAVLIEALRIEGQRTEERAYRDGRWELGRRLHQRRVDTWACDIEQLASRYGSRVRLAWQRVDSGASARVRVRRWSGGLVSGLRLTQPVTMLPGESYAVDLRLVDGVDAAVPIINAATTEPVTTRDIAFASPRPESAAPRGGDLVAFGIATKVSEDVEIIGIEPGEGLTATLTGIRYVAPLLMAGETGPIPELQTRLTRVRAASPPPPRLLGVQPDPSGVRVSFEMPPWSGSPIAGFSARWRPTPAEGNETGWVSLQALGRSAMTLVTPPIRALPVAPDDVEGRTLIDVEVRAFTEAGQSSPEPLLVTSIEVREDPWPPVELVVTPAVRVSEQDGSSHGVLHVSATPLAAADGVDMVVEVRVEPVTGEPGDWDPATRPLPAGNPQGDVLGLLTGERYRTRAAWRSAGGWLSEWADGGLATVPADSNVASDTRHVDGVPASDVVVQASQVPALSALLQDAQDTIAIHQATLYTATSGLVDRTQAILDTLNTPTTGVVARVTAIDTQINTPTSGMAARLAAVDAAVFTPTSGLIAVNATQQQALADLALNKAEASTVSIVQARLFSGENMLANPSGRDGTRGWLSSGPMWSTYQHPNWGWWFTAVAQPGETRTNHYIYQTVAAQPGQFTLSGWAYAALAVPGSFFMYVSAIGVGGGELQNWSRQINAHGPFEPLTFSTPAGTVQIRVHAYLYGFEGFSQCGVARLKLETGPYATPFSDDASLTVLDARATVSEANIATITTNKADASRVALVEAKVAGSGFVNDNADLSIWTDPAALPASWFYYNNGPSRVAGVGQSTYAARYVTNGTSYGARIQPFGLSRGWQVVTTEITLNSGSYEGIGVLFRPLDQGGSELGYPFEGYVASYPEDSDPGGTTIGAGVAGRTYRQSHLIDCSGPAYATMKGANVYLMIDGFFNAIPKDVTVRVLGVRRATPTEVEMRKARGVHANLTARYAAVEQATADLSTGKASVTRVEALEARAGGANLLTKSQWFVGEGSSPAPWQTGNGGLNGWSAYVHPNPVTGPGANELPLVATESGAITGAYGEFGSPFVPVKPGSRICFSAYAVAAATTVTIFVYYRDASGAIISHGSGDTATTNLANTGNVGTLENWVRIWGFHTVPAGAATAGVFLRKFSHTAGFTYSEAWFLRPMLSEATPTQTLPPPYSGAALEAQVVEAKQATATLEGRLESRALLQAVAGNQIAGMQLLAVSGPDASYSAINFWATAVQISNAGSNAIAPFEVRGNVVRMREAVIDRVSVGTEILVGTRRLKLAVQPFPISVTDGVPVSFGYDIGLTPEIVFLRDGPVSQPGTGESNNYYAEAASGTGFTPRLKITTASPPSNQTAGPTGGTNDGVRIYYLLAGPGGAVNNTVNVRVTGSLRSYLDNPNYNPGGPIQIEDGSASQSGYMVIQLWKYHASLGWQTAGQIYVSPPYRGGQYDASGYYDDPFDITQAVTVDPSINYVGAGVDYEEFAASYLTDVRLAYQIATSSGTRSATPNGELTTAMVYPKNGT